jgi:Cof subfamily protein (haloacid dehalogenase superfamily)
MVIKLVALDLDGTIIPERGVISARTREVIQRVQGAGVTVVLATGRAYSSALEIAEHLGIHAPLITYGGALVKESGGGKILFEQRLPVLKAQKAFNWLKALNLHINLHLPEGVYAERMRPEVDLYHGITSTRLKLVGDLSPYLKQKPYKLTAISAHTGYLKAIERKLKAYMQDEVNISSSLPQFLEVLDHRTSKSKALDFLCQHLRIKPEEVMAVGDGFNDADMLHFAGLGVAMGNAPPELKALADYVTTKAEEDGVALALEQHILK